MGKTMTKINCNKKKIKKAGIPLLTAILILSTMAVTANTMEENQT